MIFWNACSIELNRNISINQLSPHSITDSPTYWLTDWLNAHCPRDTSLRLVHLVAQRVHNHQKCLDIFVICGRHILLPPVNSSVFVPVYLCLSNRKKGFACILYRFFVQYMSCPFVARTQLHNIAKQFSFIFCKLTRN